MAQSLTEGGQP